MNSLDSQWLSIVHRLMIILSAKSYIKKTGAMTNVDHPFGAGSALSFQLKGSRENHLRVQSSPVMIEKMSMDSLMFSCFYWLLPWPITVETNGLRDDNFLVTALLVDFLNVLIGHGCCMIYISCLHMLILLRSVDAEGLFSPPPSEMYMLFQSLSLSLSLIYFIMYVWFNIVFNRNIVFNLMKLNIFTISN